MCKGYSKEVIAASCQRAFESIVIEWADYWISKGNHKNVFLAGGTFANVLLNQKVLEIPGVEYIYIHPAMTDAGLGVGAALEAYHKLRDKMGAPFQPVQYRNVYFGPGFSDEDIERALSEAEVEYHRPDDLEMEVAKAIVDGKIVARYEGNLEYGPRALGHRSILYHTQDKTVNDWLNSKLQRTEFMPFAPVTLYEKADICYKVELGKDPKHAMQFMTITADCTDEMKKLSPAVIHVDGTARPQLVREEDSPSYYQILKYYYELTGIPSVVNTSFNMHEEPIVCTPEEATRAFLQSGVDILAVGPFIAIPKS
jgi:carbamoyltransferase